MEESDTDSLFEDIGDQFDALAHAGAWIGRNPARSFFFLVVFLLLVLGVVVSAGLWTGLILETSEGETLNEICFILIN